MRNHSENSCARTRASLWGVGGWTEGKLVGGENANEGGRITALLPLRPHGSSSARSEGCISEKASKHRPNIVQTPSNHGANMGPSMVQTSSERGPNISKNRPKRFHTLSKHRLCMVQTLSRERHNTVHALSKHSISICNRFLLGPTVVQKMEACVFLHFRTPAKRTMVSRCGAGPCYLHVLPSCSSHRNCLE